MLINICATAKVKLQISHNYANFRKCAIYRWDMGLK